MLSKKEKDRIFNMTPEERKADLLNSMSDAVRELARKIAMMKAIAKEENGVDPAEFDKALNRELDKAWDKVKDKNGQELALIGLLELAVSGEDIAKILED